MGPGRRSSPEGGHRPTTQAMAPPPQVQWPPTDVPRQDDRPRFRTGVTHASVPVWQRVPLPTQALSAQRPPIIPGPDSGQYRRWTVEVERSGRRPGRLKVAVCRENRCQSDNVVDPAGLEPAIGRVGHRGPNGAVGGLRNLCRPRNGTTCSRFSHDAAVMPLGDLETSDGRPRAVRLGAADKKPPGAGSASATRRHRPSA